jgi:hypothetical protein
MPYKITNSTMPNSDPTNAYAKFAERFKKRERNDSGEKVV